MHQPRLLTKYHQDIVPAFRKDAGVSHNLAVPKLEKIVISSGITDEQHRKEALENMSQQIAIITGQKPIITHAKTSIASFKLREGDPVGLKVTLRGRKMYQFLDKLISIVLPRVRDFQGVSLKSFDGSGNYTLGLTEQIIFPEVEYDKIDKVRGLEITLVTTSRDNAQAKKLLELFGFPLTKQPDSAKSKS